MVAQCHSVRINIYLVFLSPAQASHHQIIDEPVRQCWDKPPSLSEMGLRGLRLKVRDTDIIIFIFLSTSTDYSDFVFPLRENHSALESWEQTGVENFQRIKINWTQVLLIYIHHSRSSGELDLVFSFFQTTKPLFHNEEKRSGSCQFIEWFLSFWLNVVISWLCWLWCWDLKKECSYIVTNLVFSSESSGAGWQRIFKSVAISD